MQTRKINKNGIDFEISQYEGKHSLVLIYKLLNAKIIETVDIWVLKDTTTGQPVALRAGVKCNIPEKNMDIFLKKFDNDIQSSFQETNYTYLYFEQCGKDKVIAQVRHFIANLCKIDGLAPQSFDFMLDISLLNKEMGKEQKNQQEVSSSRPRFGR